jgi:hypothetical protein
MPGGWVGSNRRAELPPEWEPVIRPRILKRDEYRCRWIDNGQRCTQPATDVDHKGDKHDHSDRNLRALCAWHHGKRTSEQGNAARVRVSNRRAAERHPGLLSQRKRR